ncbi:unnamed protein product [Cochlearia groenlandica]
MMARGNSLLLLASSSLCTLLTKLRILPVHWCSQRRSPRWLGWSKGRTQLNFSYEKLLTSALSQKEWDEDRLKAFEEVKTSAEKERGEALAKVEGLEKDLRHSKKEKRVKKLKEELERVELENTELNKKLKVATESSKARDLELELSRKVEADVSGELET